MYVIKRWHERNLRMYPEEVEHLLASRGATSTTDRVHDRALPSRKAPMTSIYDFEATRIDGQPAPLDAYRGKVLLIVNTASQCGFTPQFGGLEDLYKSYAGRGLVVLGFPSNQFGAQDPGSNDEIGAFCTRNYGVSFPMMTKVDVNGVDAAPLFRWLVKEKPGLLGIGGDQVEFHQVPGRSRRTGDPAVCAARQAGVDRRRHRSRARNAGPRPRQIARRRASIRRGLGRAPG